MLPQAKKGWIPVPFPLQIEQKPLNQKSSFLPMRPKNELVQSHRQTCYSAHLPNGSWLRFTFWGNLVLSRREFPPGNETLPIDDPHTRTWHRAFHLVNVRLSPTWSNIHFWNTFPFSTVILFLQTPRKAILSQRFSTSYA